MPSTLARSAVRYQSPAAMSALPASTYWIVAAGSTTAGVTVRQFSSANFEAISLSTPPALPSGMAIVKGGYS